MNAYNKLSLGEQHNYNELVYRLRQIDEYLQEGRISKERHDELVSQAHAKRRKADTGYYDYQSYKDERRARCQ